MDERVLDMIVGLSTGRPRIEQLEILRIPWRLPEDPETWPHGPGMCAPGGPPLHVLWTMDTRYWAFDIASGDAAALATFAQISARVEAEKEQFALRHEFVHDGESMTVLTDFCRGFDLNTEHPGEPPLIFETAVWDASRQPFGRMWRYATARAARAGHAQIVDALA